MDKNWYTKKKNKARKKEKILSLRRCLTNNFVNSKSLDKWEKYKILQFKSKKFKILQKVGEKKIAPLHNDETAK